MLVRAILAFTGCCHVVCSLEWITLVSCSRQGQSARIHLKPNQIWGVSSSAAKFTFQVVVAGDDLDVDVLGDGGEGDLEAADGGRVGAPRLHVRQPGALHFQLRWVREVFKQLVVETGFCLFNVYLLTGLSARNCWLICIGPADQIVSVCFRLEDSMPVDKFQSFLCVSAGQLNLWWGPIYWFPFMRFDKCYLFT